MSYTNGIDSAVQSEALQTSVSASTRTARTTQTAASVETADATNQTPTTDNAKLSTAGGVVAQALLGSDTRTDKVASIQQAIVSGTYNVPSSAVADKLIAAMLR